MDRTNSITGTLTAYACGGAFASAVLGLAVGHMFIRQPDIFFSAAAVLSSAALVFALMRARYTVKRLPVNEGARASARQFLWSCVFFAMIAWMLGLQVAGASWFGSDWLRRFGWVFWGLMTLIAVFPVRRDARRVANAAGVRKGGRDS